MEKRILLNRIIAFIAYILGVLICEHLKLSSGVCFTFALFWIIFISYIFTVIKGIIGENNDR